MSQKGFINIVIIVVIVILAGAGAYFVLSRQAQPTPTPGAPTPGPITVNGEIVCLPKTGSGVVTMECAIGLKELNGRHYGLRNLDQHDPDYKFSVIGLRVEVSGNFSSKSRSEQYDIVGTIDVTAIKEISDSLSSKLHPRLKELIEQGLPSDSIEVVINLRETASRADVIKSFQPYDIVVLEQYLLLNGFLARLPLKSIERIAAHPDVLYISPKLSGEPPPNSEPDREQISLREGQRNGPFLLEKIYPDRVIGLNFLEYPISIDRGTPVTLHIGEVVSNGCTITLTLTRIEGDTATFTKETDPKGIRICPICLAGSTLIDTPSGFVPVKDLQVGMPIWTIDKASHRVSGIVTKTSKVPVPSTHQMVHLVLDDGRELFVSPGHPTTDGQTIGNLAPGDLYDNASVISTNRVSYGESATYDILPSGDTGFYWANGILIGSTLR